jgi:hypothetical protein
VTDISEPVTLASLRAKTDRELIAIIDSALERGLGLLRRRTNEGVVDQHRAEAEQAYTEATKLLSAVYGLSDPERFQLEGKLAEIRRSLTCSLAPHSLPHERGDRHTKKCPLT